MIESPKKMIKNEIQKSRIGTELENFSPRTHRRLHTLTLTLMIRRLFLLVYGLT